MSRGEDPGPRSRADAKFRLGALWPMFLVWLDTRRYSRLAYGLVAVVVLAGMVVVLELAHRQPRSSTLAVYRRMAHDAISREDRDAARLLFRRCLWIDPDDVPARMGLAAIARDEGDLRQMFQMLSHLAPHDGTGEPIAHLRLAQELWDQLNDDKGATDEEGDAQGRTTPDEEVGLPEPQAISKTVEETQQLALIRHHVERAVDARASDAAARKLLIQVLLKQRELERAGEEMVALARIEPRLALSVATPLKQIGYPDKALDAARRAERYWESQRERSPDDVQIVINQVGALLFQDRDDRAEELIVAAMRKGPNRQLQQLLSIVLVRRYDRMTEDDSGSTAERLHLLSHALRLSPENTGALTRMAELTAVEGPEADAARKTLKQALAGGVTPAVVHMALGITALRTGDSTEAKTHMEAALALSPNVPVVMNNLAYTLYVSDPPELDSALELVNSAIELSPNQPEFRATRGVILAELERWEEATVDLELALAKFPKRKHLHLALAEVWQHRGDADLAELHRQRATDADATFGVGEQPDLLPN